VFHKLLYGFITIPFQYSLEVGRNTLMYTNLLTKFEWRSWKIHRCHVSALLFSQWINMQGYQHLNKTCLHLNWHGKLINLPNLSRTHSQRVRWSSPAGPASQTKRTNHPSIYTALFYILLLLKSPKYFENFPGCNL
jgi:hypothetical protein